MGGKDLWWILALSFACAFIIALVEAAALSFGTQSVCEVHPLVRIKINEVVKPRHGLVVCDCGKRAVFPEHAHLAVRLGVFRQSCEHDLFIPCFGVACERVGVRRVFSGCAVESDSQDCCDNAGEIKAVGERRLVHCQWRCAYVLKGRGGPLAFICVYTCGCCFLYKIDLPFSQNTHAR